MVAQMRQNLPQEIGFYRKYYQSFMIALIVAFLLAIAAVVVVLYQIFNRPLPHFKAIATNGKEMKLTAFNEPNYLPSTLLRWASKAAVAAYTFDFVNYNKQIGAARPFFTSLGWADYQNSVQALIRTITQRKLFVNGVVSGTPVISNQGDLPGKGYVWRIQIPFLVTYQSADTTTQQRFYVMMTLVKVPTTVDPTGIGIDQFIMR